MNLPESVDSSFLAIFKRVTEKEPQEHYYTVLLGIEPLTTYDLIELLKVGFSSDAWEQLVKYTHLPQSVLLEIIHLNRTSFFRQKREGNFTPAQSESILRFARVLGKVLLLYDGDIKSALLWLSKPHRFLGDRSPFDLIDTETGANEVLALIGRMEHGVFS